MGFGHTELVRDAVAPYRCAPPANTAVAVDLAAAVMRQFSAAIHPPGIQSDALAAAAGGVFAWLVAQRCVAPSTRALFLAREGAAPPAKHKTQAKRASVHADVPMPPAVLPAATPAHLRRDALRAFAAADNHVAWLDVAQARALLHAARSVYEERAVHLLRVLACAERPDIAVEQGAPLPEGEAGALEWALRRAEAGERALVVTNDTDVFGGALAKRARIAALGAGAGGLWVYDFFKGVFVDLVAFSRGYGEAGARATLLTWIAGGTDFTPDVLGSVAARAEAMFEHAAGSSDRELALFIGSQKRRKTLIDGRAHLAQMRWVAAYMATADGAPPEWPADN
jgi:hypothetical protein